MKIAFKILFLCMLVIGCDSATDCLKSAGETTTTSLETELFSAIEINTEFNVVIKQGPEQQVQLTTGENLIDEINYEVIDETFIIRNTISCRWTRSYDFPTLTITHPNLVEIRLGGSGRITSDGVLNYPNLTLLSEDQSGDFALEVNCERLAISNNDVTNFYISGETNYLYVGFHSGDGRFEGAGLKAQQVEINHCGSNDIIVHATEALKGKVCASGNLIYVKTTPPVVAVSTTSNGQLIDRTE